MTEKELLLRQMAAQPNMFAPTSSYNLSNGIVTVTGYQTYTYDIESASLRPLGSGLVAKADLFNSFFSSNFLRGKKVIDLGGNNGFFSLQSILKGASSAMTVDVDEEAVCNVTRLSKDANLSNLKAIKANVANFSSSGDVVYAFALIHWVFDLTTGFGSLESALFHLKSLVNQVLVVEWVDSCDPKIVRCDHIKSKENDFRLKSYNEDNFKQILFELFGFVAEIGSVNETRRIYLACSSSCAWRHFPLIYLREKYRRMQARLKRKFG